MWDRRTPEVWPALPFPPLDLVPAPPIRQPDVRRPGPIAVALRHNNNSRLMVAGCSCSCRRIKRLCFVAQSDKLIISKPVLTVCR